MSGKRVHLFIEGKVQGVYFRATTKEKANENNVKGWVKNLPDGRVEAVFEGEENMVDKLVEFCHKGPDRANVINIDVKKEEYKNEFNEFKVKY
ncbi:acylphosphatase [Methanonatronarchaeum sp. AMET-Sl]|uniref:acylphosphatase n=1 Tax=Methanonatronarchaeum sp. AMET-Sl TaxID=3037654 RepID=UPI00244E1551|nr:acylphosphatase [Methanonatronarchaeum sp. AMET-Sl]WGI17088.1 acylphosphatase [Methanonatronarchaeum sp. AMET-Sl]